MIDILKREMNVSASMLDMNAKLGVMGSVVCLQDTMCEYFKLLGCDGPTMIPACNTFFVVAKTLIKFVGDAFWLDSITSVVEVSKKSKVRVNLSNNIYKGDELIVVGVQEMCAVDNDDRKVRLVDTTLFPKDIKINNDNNEGLAFSRFTIDISSMELVEEVIVKTTNIDLYNHMNNCEYVRILLNTLDIGEFKDVKVSEFEIHYISQTIYGDRLKIYKKNDVGCVYWVVLSQDGNIAISAKMSYNIDNKL